MCSAVTRTPDLVHRVDLQARSSGGDQEDRRTPAGLLFRPGLGHGEDEIGDGRPGGVQLRALDEEGVPVGHGGRRDRRGVRAGAGLGQREGELAAAGSEPRYQGLPLLIGPCQQHQEAGEDRVYQIEIDRRAAVLRQLLGDEHHVEEIPPFATQRRGDRHPQQTALGHRGVERRRELGRAVEGLDGRGSQMRGAELRDPLLELLLRWAEREIHGPLPRTVGHPVGGRHRENCLLILP
jgi:hypothetical protein